MPEKSQQKADHPIGDLMEMVIGKAGEEGASTPVTIFLILALVLGVSIVGLKMAMAKRKAAKAARELRKLKEEKHRAAENAKLEENAQKKSEAEKKLKELQKKEATLANELLDYRLNHMSYVDDLKSVTTWDDIIVVDGRDE